MVIITQMDRPITVTYPQLRRVVPIVSCLRVVVKNEYLIPGLVR